MRVHSSFLRWTCDLICPEIRKQARRQIDQRKVIPPSPTREPEIGHVNAALGRSTRTAPLGDPAVTGEQAVDEQQQDRSDY